MGSIRDKVAAAAPRGDANAVFDLSAEIIDPDGEGGDPPTGIALTWTERCIGDYDQNGLVNASDLTPLGVYWEEAVKYDVPRCTAASRTGPRAIRMMMVARTSRPRFGSGGIPGGAGRCARDSIRRFGSKRSGSRAGPPAPPGLCRFPGKWWLQAAHRQLALCAHRRQRQWTH